MDIGNLGTGAFWDLMRTDPMTLARGVCEIDLVDMEKTLQQHPALRAWVSAAFETSRIEEERAKWELTKIRSKVLLLVKETQDPHTGKAKTVGIMEAEVNTHLDVEEATTKLHDIQEKRATLRAMADSLEDRKDMLIQIAAKQRKEAEDYS